MIETTQIYVDNYDIPMPEAFKSMGAALEWVADLTGEEYKSVNHKFKIMRARLVKKGMLDMDKF